MPDYNSNEIVDKLLVLGECRGNYRRAAALYYQRFPRWRHSNDSMIRIIERRERRRIRKRYRQRRDRNNIEDVKFRVPVLMLKTVTFESDNSENT